MDQTPASVTADLATRRTRHETLQAQLAASESKLDALHRTAAQALADGTSPPAASQLQSLTIECESLRRAVALLAGQITALEGTQRSVCLQEAEEAERAAHADVHTRVCALEDAFCAAVRTTVQPAHASLQDALRTAYIAEQHRNAMARAAGAAVPVMQNRARMSLRGHGRLLQLAGEVVEHVSGKTPSVMANSGRAIVDDRAA